MKPKYQFVQKRNRNVIVTVASAIIVSFSPSAFAVDNNWTGTDTNWNNTANWSLGRLPANPNGAGVGDTFDDAVINTPGTFPIVVATTGATPRDIMVGRGSGNTGRVEHRTGTVTYNGWAYLGRNSGTGTYVLADTSTVGGGITGYGLGSGTLTSGGRLWVGGTWNGEGAGGSATLLVNTSGGITCNDLAVGSANNTGVMLVEAGTINTNGWNFIGKNEGTTGANGTLTMSGGTLNNTGRTFVGEGGCTGVINLQGGTYKQLNNEVISIGDGGSGNGTVNVTNSSSLLQANGELWVGQNNATGNLTISAGNITSGNWVAVGRDGGNGTVTQTGGTWTKTGGGSAFIIGASGPGTYNHSAGLVDVQGGDTWMGENNTCNYTLSNTGEFRATYFQVARNGSSTGNVNLNGGTLRVNQIAGGGGTEHISFNGTEIIARVSHSNFIAGIDSAGAVIDAGGLKINSNGFTLTAPQVLTGTGNVIKLGAGKLTLSGISSYSGSNNVNAGELVLSSSSSGTGDINVADGAAVGVSATLLVGDQLTTTNAAFGTTAAGTTLNLGIGNAAGVNPSTSILDITGNLTLAGNVTVNVSGSQFQAANLPLVSYNAATRSGAGVFNLGTVPNGVVATIVDDPNFYGPNQGLVYLNITSVALPKWDGTDAAKYVKTGDTTLGSFDVTVTDASNIAIGQKAVGGGIPLGAVVTNISGFIVTLDQAATDSFASEQIIFTLGTGSNDGVWDINTTQNWVDQVTSSNSVYKNPNPVLFNDTATGPTAVTLNTTVLPSEVVFDNTTRNYSVSGTGSISGTSSLTKSGTGSLTLSTVNDYTGATTLSGGTTTASSITGVTSVLGAESSDPAKLVINSGTLNYTGTTASSIRGLTISGADSAISVPAGEELSLSGSVVSGVGSSFNKLGDGTLTLTNPSVTLGASGQVDEIMGGTIKLDGGGSQTVSAPGELWVGSSPGVSGNLILNQTALTTGSWIAVGIGNGDGAVSTLSATDSTITSGGFSTGYFRNLPNNNSDQNVTLSGNTVWTNNGGVNLAESLDSSSVWTIGGTSSFTSSDRVMIALGQNSTGSLVIQDSGSLNKTGGWLSIGTDNNGVGTALIKNSGSLTSNGDFNIGDVGTSNGTLNVQDSGSVVSTGPVFIGKNGTTGAVNLSGAATMSSGDTNVGGNGSSHGNLNIAGTSTYTSNGRLQVGPGGGSVGSVLIENSGSMTVNSYVSVGYGGSGSMTLKDNAVFSNTDDFSVNENGDVAATVTVQDNASLSAARTIFVGRNNTRVGTLTVSGTATVNQNGATYSFLVGPAGTGTLNIQGSSAVNVAANGGMVITNNASGTGTVNLDGGTLTVKKVSDGGGNSTFNFNGGVLKAGTGAALDFLNGLNNLNLNPGGAFIDTNGQTIAIGQSIADAGGALTKQGTGTLLINSVNAYVGTTTVAAGTLGGTGSVGGALIVSASGTINPGASAGTFTADDTFGDGSSIAGTYVCEIDGGSADKLNIGGSLDITGATVDFNELSAPTSGVYIIATYASLTGTFTELDVPSGYTVDYNYLGLNQIALVGSVSAYESWASLNGLDPNGDGAPDQDPDSDGQSNAIEFALGGDPASGSDNAKIYSLVADGSVDGDSDNELLLTIAVRTGTPGFSGSPSPTATQDGFTYTVQGSNDLGTFTANVTPVSPVTTGLPAAPAGYEYRTFSLDGSNGMPTKGFLRVEISN